MIAGPPLPPETLEQAARRRERLVVDLVRQNLPEHMEDAAVLDLLASMREAFDAAVRPERRVAS